MNILQPTKLHFYTYRKPYLIFFTLILSLTVSSLYFFKNISNISLYVTIATIIATSLFTFIMGIYEYSHLIFHYLNLKTIRKEFFYSSVIQSLINALLQTALIFSVFKIIDLMIVNTNLTTIFPFTSFLTYLITFISQITIFVVSSILTIFLRKIKYIKIIIYCSIVIMLSLFFFQIVDGILTYIHSFYTNNILIYQLIPISLAISCLLWTFIYSKIFRVRK